jgi:hypothetical protein
VQGRDHRGDASQALDHACRTRSTRGGVDGGRGLDP